MEQLGSNASGYEQAFSLRKFLTVIFKRKPVIISFFVSLVVIVTIGSFLLPHIYRAGAKLLVEQEVDSEKALLFRMELRSPGHYQHDFINSEIEIINSYPVAERLVKALSLDRLEQPERPVSEGEQHEQFEKAVAKFQRDLTVENIKNSNIIHIGFENKDPQIASRVVKNVIDFYINYRSELSNETEAYKFFQEQMQIADEQLRELEQRQAEYKQEKEVISPESQRNILMTRLENYEENLTAVRTQWIGKEAKLAIIKKQSKKGKEINIPSTEASNSLSREKHIAKLRGDLLDMEIQRERLLQKFTPQYDEVVHLDRQIAATKLQIKNEVQQIISMEEISIKSLKAEEAALQSSIEGVKKEIAELAQDEYEFNQLSRGVDDSREVYSMLLKQREEARISLAKLQKGVKVKVISPPVTPTEPVKPKRKLNVALALFLGLIGGVGLAFLMEHFDDSISSPDELEKYTGLALLGTVRELSLPKPK